MAHDIDVAAYIYQQQGWMDSWRLQKLTYYSQAWSLAWTGRPLFDERLQAWDDGPVAPDLFRANKYDRVGTTIRGADVAHLREADQRIVDAVIAFYGDMGKSDIINLTHAEPPWKVAYDRGRNTEIAKPSMTSYYSKAAALELPGPARPELPEPTVTAVQFMEHLAIQRQIWAGTLELLAR